jgi:hypothetical protein
LATGFWFSDDWRESNTMVSGKLDLGDVDGVPAPSRAIRDVRVAQGLSLRALSARAGLPYSTLSKLEN